MAKDKEFAGATTPLIIDHDWSTEEEVQLFHAMEGLRPFGINKHFYMSCISERLSKSLNRDMPSTLIWRQLGKMYKLKELDDLETLPFPNEEREFFLPEHEYATLLMKKTAGASAAEDTKDMTPTSEAITVSLTADSNGKVPSKQTVLQSNQSKDLEKKVSVKLELPKRSAKRTRGSISNESISPSTTPPPVQTNKRRRI
ncbi:MRG/MORF4L-binding protein [Scaptodrosophila lebanonensis]|uniref:MRG/MORF4L-binding protein n=1 Tax=Drosophila lebanonensis TaxID=7225 RepID=A0A6J2UIF4_DROLE|nr:MRG/MORF4L-binding protein [Scaptodrosophila lebanonensis]